ncbi:alpha/beta hydrolase family protein, partial [Synoicihabitans lomoniglobus]|nr:acetylxylan esterase [Opitutaceae bacterium LMO-M01]
MILPRFHVALGLALLSSIPSPAQPWWRGNVATPAEARAQTDRAIGQLNPYLNAIGYAQLTRRAERVAALRTRTDAERRQVEVRQKIKDLVGGIPALSGPVAVQTFPGFDDEGFRIENIVYESAPDYWVTANVFVPDGPGPFPALIIAPGHGAGKSSQYSWGVNFARAGILVLAIDPMGQGERLQHFDPELGTSKVEPVGEHEHANQSALLVSQHIARYWFADGIRGIDYLVQRGDIDPARIGTFGCSGGGTAAAYLAAMDERIAVAAVSSFITSFTALLPGHGPQDAEQTLPGFIAADLDFADWVELAAPRPYAIIAFEEDFFPLVGAQQAHAEAERFYGLFNATDQLKFIRGPGGHCNLGAVSPELLRFLITHLVGPHAPIPALEPRRPTDTDVLNVTPTGQLSTSIGSAIAEDFTRAAAAAIPRLQPFRSVEATAHHRDELRDNLRALAGVVARPGAPAPVVTTDSTASLDTYLLEHLTFASEPGITLPGLLARPHQRGPHPVVLWLDALPLD